MRWTIVFASGVFAMSIVGARASDARPAKQPDKRFSLAIAARGLGGGNLFKQLGATSAPGGQADVTLPAPAGAVAEGH
jgi:hypothetical protein